MSAVNTDEYDLITESRSDLKVVGDKTERSGKDCDLRRSPKYFMKLHLFCNQIKGYFVSYILQKCLLSAIR